MTILHMVPPSSGMLQQHIDLVDQKHEDGHGRLRQDIRKLEVDVEALKTAHAELAARVLQMAAKPVDLDEVRIAPKMVIAIVGAAITIFTANYASTWGLRSDVRDIKTNFDNMLRYQDAQLTELKKSYEALVREQALQRVRLEETRNSLAKIEGLMTRRKQ